MGILLLFLVTFTPQDAESAIQGLRSNDPGARDEAETDLIERGKTVLAKLRSQLEDRDPDFRIRIKRIINVISRRDRILLFRPVPRRVNLNLKDVPLIEASRQVFGAFGVRTMIDEGPRDNRRISLRVKDSNLWKVYDAFCRSANIEALSYWYPFSWGWLFSDKAAKTKSRTADVNNVRIVAVPRTYRSGTDKGMSLWLMALLTPGNLPLSARLEDGVLLDDQGRKLKYTANKLRLISGGVERVTGGITVAKARTGDISRADLAGAKSLTLKGKLVLVYPHDVEITRVDLPKAGKSIEIPIGNGKITVWGFEQDPREIKLQVKGIRPRVDETIVSLWLEDQKGKRLWDLGAPRPIQNVNGYYGIWMGKKTGSGTTLVIARVLSKDEVTLPFVIEDIPVPNLRK